MWLFPQQQVNDRKRFGLRVRRFDLPLKRPRSSIAYWRTHQETSYRNVGALFAQERHNGASTKFP